MKIKQIIFVLFVAGLAFVTTKAQPTDAQLKKQLTSPKTVSITLGKAGKKEWSSTYKKYVWTRYATIKLKTDEPGIFLIWYGYASYDIFGSKFSYWRTFTTSNSYEGIPDPTEKDLMDLALKLGYEGIMPDFYFRQMVGQPESLKLADEPKFEWHTLNSVSFYFVMVYTEQTAVYKSKPRRIKRVFKARIYRDDVKSAWNRVISTSESEEIL